MEIFKVTPDGVLVFFPSYKLLTKLSDRWQSTGLWHLLASHKPLFIGKQRVGACSYWKCLSLEYVGSKQCFTYQSLIGPRSSCHSFDLSIQKSPGAVKITSMAPEFRLWLIFLCILRQNLELMMISLSQSCKLTVEPSRVSFKKTYRERKSQRRMHSSHRCRNLLETLRQTEQRF